MTRVLRLEQICLNIVMKLNMEISIENIPIQLVKTIEKMKTINGNFITQDKMDRISSIGINYDGETVDLSFNIHNNIHKVSCKEDKTIPVNPALLFLTTLHQEAVMKVEIDMNVNATTVKLSSKDSLWDWNLCLEVRYDFIWI